MLDALDLLLAGSGQVVSRAQGVAAVGRAAFDQEVRTGHLVAAFPRAYCRPWDVDLPEVRDRAALVSVGAPAALSHLTALRRLGLPTCDDGRIHVTVPIRRHPSGRGSALVVHRSRGPVLARRVGGLLTVAPEQAVVRSWPLCAGPDQRAAAIVAVRRRLVTPQLLAREAGGAVGMPGLRGLQALLALLAAGCESELEIWGHLGVFDHPGLTHGRRQLRLDTRAGSFRVDLGYEDERVAVELDGEPWHSSRVARERDRRRDAALAGIGWVTLRFSHARLHRDVAGCRADTLAALAARTVWRRSR